jgi:hypothetical protein
MTTGNIKWNVIEIKFGEWTMAEPLQPTQKEYI